MSNYCIATTDNPDSLMDVLSCALGQKGTIHKGKKTRKNCFSFLLKNGFKLITIFILLYCSRVCQKKTSSVSCGSNKSTL